MKEDNQYLRAAWKRGAALLGVEIDGPVHLRLDSGVEVEVGVLVRHFGAPNGMVLLEPSSNAYGWLRTHSEDLMRSGYGYSVLDNHREGETISPETLIDILSEWGWTGTEEDAPAWLRNAESESHQDDFDR